MSSEGKPLLDASSPPVSYQDGASSGEPTLLEDKLSALSEEHHASLKQTTMNIAKTCIGTGTLALPYAFSQGGFLFSMVGVWLIAEWNNYAVGCLLKCAELLSIVAPEERTVTPSTDKSPSSSTPQKKGPLRTLSSKRRYFLRTYDEHMDIMDDEEIEICPEGTSTLGKVAFYSFGSWGLHFLDLLMMFLFVGVFISFIDLIKTLTESAHFTTGSSTTDLTIIALAIILLSSVPDLGFVHSLSAMGLSAVVVAFIVIFWFGVDKYGLAGFTGMKWAYLFPRSLTGVSNWFGVVVFGFGIVPITFNVQEAMTHPNQMGRATEIALRFTFLLYVIIGNGVAIIYAPENNYEFMGQVLEHLPSTWISTLVRLAMALTTLSTTPLIAIPCSDLVTGKLGLSPINQSLAARIAIRSSVTITCVLISALIPDFVTVVTFIGCCCLSLVGFVYPPLMHIILSIKSKMVEHHSNDKNNNSSNMMEEGISKEEPTKSNMFSMINNSVFYIDAAMVIIGVVITIFSSLLTFNNMASSTTTTPST